MRFLSLGALKALVVILAGALAAASCGRGSGSETPGEHAAPAAAGPPGRPPDVAAAAAGPPGLSPDGAADVRALPAKGVEVLDEELVDQDGRPVRLRELAKDRVLVVNFIFTTCTTICSPMTAIFGRLQAQLGDALDRDVRLVSISLDPAMDTPERLNVYAEKFGRRNGWSFLTGRRERVNRVLDALGGGAPIKERHAPITLIGREAEGRWTRVEGIAPPGRLADEVRAFLPPRGASARSVGGG
ncbi:SCO family protein [Sorangium sp. So ce448]|uniref:SCO family protein n=1 Tax=Sorangium sp. So ce448 TaxID=3133314 RepID=UPI003F60E22A